MRKGDAVLVFGTFLWLTISVGPWWVGLSLFCVGFAINAAEALHNAKVSK